MSKAADKRFAAIKMIVEAVIDAETGVCKLADTPAIRQDVKAFIEDIRVLGRTQRWQDALTKWEMMLTDTNADDLSYAFDLHFAVAQGSMYAIWANI